MDFTTLLPVFVLFATVLKAGCLSTPSPDFIRGILRTAGNYEQQLCDGTRSTACSDCSTIKICVYSDATNDDENPRQKCPAATPYCSVSPTGAVCQKTPDVAVPECSSVPADFSCTGVGFYPSPNSCQLYHYCRGVSAVPDTYDCPNGTRFSSKFIGCEQFRGDCPKICNPANAETAVFTAFPGDNQYYAYCWFNTTQSPPKLLDTFVFACGQGSTYDAGLGRCVFKCPRNGLYVNTANPKQYYSCVTLGGKLTYKEMACSADQEFDEQQKRCVVQGN